MTATDRTDATEQEFRDRIAAFESAPTPPEVREAAVVEEVARAMAGREVVVMGYRERSPMTADGILGIDEARRLAAAAVTAVRATQDGGAEAFAAAVLRAAAQEQRNEAEQVPDTDEGTHADGHRCAADFLNRRASHLDPS